MKEFRMIRRMTRIAIFVFPVTALVSILALPPLHRKKTPAQTIRKCSASKLSFALQTLIGSPLTRQLEALLRLTKGTAESLVVRPD